jgi:hypothetical protein
MVNVIKGPAALSYKGCNGRMYWYGVASGNRSCHKLRSTPERAIADAVSKEFDIPSPVPSQAPESPVEAR